MTTQYVLDIALANDDPYPDDVCPGCGADITGWRLWDCHYLPGTELLQSATTRRRRKDTPMPFTGRSAVEGVCPWDRDQLVAHAHRRRLIEEGVTRLSERPERRLGRLKVEQ